MCEMMIASTQMHTNVYGVWEKLYFVVYMYMFKSFSAYDGIFRPDLRDLSTNSAVNELNPGVV